MLACPPNFDEQGEVMWVRLERPAILREGPKFESWYAHHKNTFLIEGVFVLKKRTAFFFAVLCQATSCFYNYGACLIKKLKYS